MDGWTATWESQGHILTISTNKANVSEFVFNLAMFNLACIKENKGFKERLEEGSEKLFFYGKFQGISALPYEWKTNIWYFSKENWC